MKRKCECTNECLGYLTKECKRIEEPKQEKERGITITNVGKQETLEEHNYLQGFINQFEEEGEHQELSNEDWTVSQFLKWLKLNNFKIIKKK
jgi:hypothetical protein